MTTTITAFYRFAPVEDPAAWAEELRTAAAAAGILGTILVAGEGVNGTIAGPAEGVAAILTRIEARPGFADLPRRISHHDTPPFGKMLVKVKPEIVTLGMPLVGPTGTYVAPKDWDALLARPGMVVVDTRNGFEYGEGHFTNAIDPATASFRDFPAWAEAHLRPEQPVAMYCTGGIRCEKATALLKAKGFRQVYHLQGGILAYLEQTSNQSGAWQGNCFVFDERGTVDAALGAAPAQCREPIVSVAMDQESTGTAPTP